MKIALLLALTAAAQAATCDGSVTSPVFDNVIVPRDTTCFLLADVTGNVEVRQGATVTVEGALISGSLSLAPDAKVEVKAGAVVQGGISGGRGASVVVDVGGEANDIGCANCAEIKVFGCVTSIEWDDPLDGALEVDCTDSCFGEPCVCPSESPPSISIKGGTILSASIDNCEPEPNASAQDLLVTETTILGPFVTSNAKFSDVGMEKLSCEEAASIITLQDTVIESDVSLAESESCDFSLGPNIVLAGDVKIEKVGSVTVSGVDTAEDVNVNNAGHVAITGSKFSGSVELKESNDITIVDTCFEGGASLEKNGDVTCEGCFVGFDGIKCIDNDSLIGLDGNTQAAEKPDVIEGCDALMFEPVEPAVGCTVTV